MNVTASVADGLTELVLAGSGIEVAEDERAGDVRFAWGTAEREDARLVWVPRPALGPAGARLVAPAGESLWRRAPWPAADALFDLDPPGDPSVLVLDDRLAEEAATSLEGRRLPVTRAPRLTRAALEAAAIVVFAGEQGDSLPGEVPSILASGRVLVMTPRTPSFGFRPGVDHCSGETPVMLAELAGSVLRHWDAFESMRVHARIAAERHRASRVLSDLAVDLELGL